MKSYFGPDGPPAHWETSAGGRGVDEVSGSKDVHKDVGKVDAKSTPTLSDYLPGLLYV